MSRATERPESTVLMSPNSAAVAVARGVLGRAAKLIGPGTAGGQNSFIHDAIRGPQHCLTGSHCSWRIEMLETIAVVLVVLWIMGLVTSYTMGGFIHILLVFAVIVVLIRVIQGRRI